MKDYFNWRLGVILLIYLALAVAYSVVTPIGRGADEWAHFWYAQFIAQHGRLPASAAEREIAGYKSDWPPLYHVLAVVATGWVNTDGPPTFKYRADSIRRGLVPADGSDAILHTEDELFPWRQEILVWHLGRFLSIAFSAGTLLVTYFIGLDVFSALLPNPQPPTRNTPGDLRLSPNILAFSATAVLAFNPRFLFTGMLFNYDSLTLLLSALFLWLAIRVASGRYPRWGFWGLGALAGLALVTKYLALPLPLIILLVAWRRATGSQGSREVKSYATRSTYHVLRSRTFWKYLLQSALAYLLVSGWWFAYLIITFNEVNKYGPLLGTLAPLIRGDGSDRTVETLFAWLSGGQAPPPAYIEQQSYSAWQVVSSFFITFWGNPIAQPYPLNWFAVAMTVVMGLAAIGLILYLRFTNYELRITNLSLLILLLYCVLPLPFMLARLFGARDALEAVQGRHILFLAGPAVAVLLVWGVTVFSSQFLVFSSKLRITRRLTRLLFYGLPALLLSGALGQLIFMAITYPPPLPVRTTPFTPSAPAPGKGVTFQPSSFTLPGGAQLLSASLLPAPSSLRVDLIWRGGDDFAPEDYQLELALVDGQGQAVAGWRGYQTQARYPTRAWEPGDIVRDTGWLPLAAVPPGEYAVQWRLLGAGGPLFEWQTLENWRIANSELLKVNGDSTFWRDGQPTTQPVTFNERETAQVIFNPKSRAEGPLWEIQNPKLIDPDGQSFPPAFAGPGWANFIIEPNWPAGDYRLPGAATVALRVAPSRRSFLPPADISPLAADFAGKIGLLGYRLPSRRAQPGDGLPVTLVWQAQEWLGEDLVMFTRLLDAQQTAHGGYDRRARENYSTLLWAPGEVVTDGFAVPVDADAPNGVYWLSVGWYRRGAQAESLPLLDPTSGQPAETTAVTIGPIKVGGPPPGATIAEAAPQEGVDVVFGEQIKLLGYDMGLDFVESDQNPKSKMPDTAGQALQNLKVTFYWQALRQPEADYTVFVHVRDNAGNVSAQKDQPPLAGAYPTGLWDAGEIIKDDVSVPLDGLPPGRYRVVAGLYNFASGQRLPVAGSAAGEIELYSFDLE